MEKRLYKNTERKMISGVLAGFSDYLGVDVTILRVIYVLLSVFTDGFPGLVLYIILAIVMPERKEQDTHTYRNKDNAYKSYEKNSDSKTYQDVEYKENPQPEDIQSSYKKSGGAYTPEDRDR
ncbi:PspC domain-containing protein [Proteiniclasticum sp.]|uniref:PspC domain-containing protein n=1 Tax=Proteiniclasticum sp. TaxID=2053595 RepID=UPI0028A034B9|nr:PspC domain-containing protein [Proteiniclasticum sp.]